MTGQALWPLAITTGGAVIAGLGGALIATVGAAHFERSRTRTARAEAIATERHRLEQANLLELQLALAELAAQTHVLAANIVDRMDARKVPQELRWDWVATQRRARVLAQRVLDEDLRGSVRVVIDKLEAAIIGQKVDTVQEQVTDALGGASSGQERLGEEIRRFLAGPAASARS